MHCRQDKNGYYCIPHGNRLFTDIKEDKYTGCEECDDVLAVEGIERFHQKTYSTLESRVLDKTGSFEDVSSFILALSAEEYEDVPRILADVRYTGRQHIDDEVLKGLKMLGEMADIAIRKRNGEI